MLGVLPSAWLVGGCVGLLAHGLPVFPLPILSLLILGTLVAADLRVPLPAVTALAVGLGLVHGVLNGVAMQQALGPGTAGYADCARCAYNARGRRRGGAHQPWARMAVRVAGS